MILLIGGMGFIGQSVALRLLEVGEEVVITQYRAHRLPEPLASEAGARLHVAQMDVRNTFEVFDVARRHRVDSIINLMAPPARSGSTPADYHLYTTGLENVLQAAQTFGLRRVSLGSSVGVYNGLPAGPFREDQTLPVESPTQVSAFKKAMEIHALYWATQAKLDVALLRIASIYGPRYYSMFNPVSRICHAAVTGGEPDFSDRPGGVLHDGDQADWTFVEDVARGIQMVHAAPVLRHRIYNIGSGRSTSNGAIFAAVRRIVPDARCAALAAGRSPRSPENAATDLSRIGELGYAPEHTIETGIAAYVDWLRKNPQ